MSLIDDNFESWYKKAEDKGLLARQLAAHKAMRSDASALIAKPELVRARAYESFKLGTLAGLLAAAAGAALGAPLGVAEIGAMLGGYGGLLGGAVKGQADVNKKFLKEKGFEPKGINILRYMVPDLGAAHVATTLLPESGHLSV